MSTSSSICCQFIFPCKQMLILQFVMMHKFGYIMGEIQSSEIWQLHNSVILKQ